MRCHYLSDLHLERQEFAHALPDGELLVVAGDLCHAQCLDPAMTDAYSVAQRDRVMRFAESARAKYAHVIMIAGNHEHHDGIFENTHDLLREHLPSFTILDNSHTDIAGVRFFGSTLWSDFDGRDTASMQRLRRGIGDYFFIKTRNSAASQPSGFEKFQPEDALRQFDRSLAAMKSCLDTPSTGPIIVITHHAPSRLGLDHSRSSNGKDGGFASDLDAMIEQLERVPVWVHGHTHVQRRYRIGSTQVVTNSVGLRGRDIAAEHFSPNAYFEI